MDNKVIIDNTEYLSFEKKNIKFLFLPEYYHKTKFSIEDNKINDEWLKGWCSYWYDENDKIHKGEK